MTKRVSKYGWWLARLDRLKAARSWTDVKLAQHLNIGCSMLGHVRAKRRELPPVAKAKLLSALGYEMTASVVFALLPDATQEVLSEIDEPRLIEIFSSDTSKNQGRELPPEYNRRVLSQGAQPTPCQALSYTSSMAQYSDLNTARD